MMREAGGPFVAGSQVTICDCVTMATSQIADEFMGVPVRMGDLKLACIIIDHIAFRPVSKLKRRAAEAG